MSQSADHKTDDQLQYAIGLDIGGTKIAGGLVDLTMGRVLHKQVIPTLPARGGQAVLADALALAQELLCVANEIGCSVLGIGIGICELVDLQGNVTSDFTIKWRGLPVQAEFAKLAPTLIESDAHAPALAEVRYGAGRPYRLFTYITVGTGISYCLVQESRPYTGTRGNALTLASSPLTTTCTTCGTVLQPILEEFAGGPALVRRYNVATGQHFTRGEEVMAAVARGDAIAREIVRSAGEALGVSVGWLVNVLDPEAVIVGGGLGSTDGLYWDSFVAATRTHIWSDINRDLPILHAALGADAGLIGAAAQVII